MSIGEKLTNKMFKWAVLYPGFRKFVNWVYNSILKMPQYHIDMAPGQIGTYVLLVDDPQDAEKPLHCLTTLKQSPGIVNTAPLPARLTGQRSSHIGGYRRAFRPIGCTNWLRSAEKFSFISVVGWLRQRNPARGDADCQGAVR